MVYNHSVDSDWDLGDFVQTSTPTTPTTTTTKTIATAATTPSSGLRRTATAYKVPEILYVVISLALPALHWGLTLASISNPITQAITASLAAAGVLALLNKFHPTNSYVASAICGLATANPVGIFVGYIGSLMLNASRIGIILPAAVVLLATSLLPIIPWPTFPLVGLFLIVASVPYLRVRSRRNGMAISTEVEVVDADTYLHNYIHTIIRVMALAALMGLSPLLSGGSASIMAMIFALSTFGINASESVTNGMGSRRMTEKQKSNQRTQELLNPSPEALPFWKCFYSLIICFVGVGVGAGSMGRRMGLHERLCFLLETVVEGYCLKALLTLGEVVPQRSPLSDIMLDVGAGYINQGMESTLLNLLGTSGLICIIVLGVILFLALLTQMKPAAEDSASFHRERAINIVSVAVVTGFNPVAAATTFAAAYVAKRYLPDECEFIFPLMAAVGYKAK